MLLRKAFVQSARARSVRQTFRPPLKSAVQIRSIVTSGVPRSHCSCCGTLFIDEQFPRSCHSCGQQTFDNPIPVGVGVVPVLSTQVDEDWKPMIKGFLAVRRAIKPHIGGLCFPGGFLEANETVEHGVAREVWEETGFQINPNELILMNAVSSRPIRNRLLIFYLSRTCVTEEQIKSFKSNTEVSELVAANVSTALCFDIHQQILSDIYKKYDGVKSLIWYGE